MKKRTLALALACALSLSLLTACGGTDEPVTDPAAPEQEETVLPETEQPETEVPETEQTEETEQPETAALELSHVDVTLKSEGSNFILSSNLAGAKLYFGSEDESIATVDESGKVTAVAPGKTTILVETEDGQSAACIVRCDWKSTETKPQEKPVATTVSLQAFVNDLAAKHGENFAANADIVEYGMVNDLYPGLSDISTKQLVILQPMMGAVVCEIALAEVSNSSDVDAVKTIFQNRINAQVDGGAWYPASIEGWEKNSRIVTNGNYVMMIAWDYCDDAVSAFNALF